MADEEKQGISKYLDEIGLGILAGLIKGLIYDEQGRNRFSLLAELIGQNTTAINKRALKATESDATDANSYVKKADRATNADTVDNKHASDFATSAQGTKADSAVQTIKINGTAQTKTNGVVNLPAYPTVPTKTSDLTNDSGFITSSSVPTVNNGTLTIKAGGTSKGTFTANQSGNTEVNITASDLGLSSALKYVGAVSTLPTPTTTDNYNNGDVVSVGDKEYLRTGKTSSSAGSWKELGDESSHALKTITITGTGALSGGGTLEQNRTITHTNSGVTAGTYKSVTVNAYGHVTAGTNPTTISGYGITDAKIANGTITLGSKTITPITSHQDISGLVKTSDLTASTAIANSHVELADGTYSRIVGNTTLGSTSPYTYNFPWLTIDTSKSVYDTINIVCATSFVVDNANCGTIIWEICCKQSGVFRVRIINNSVSDSNAKLYYRYNSDTKRTDIAATCSRWQRISNTIISCVNLNGNVSNAFDKLSYWDNPTSSASLGGYTEMVLGGHVALADKVDMSCTRLTASDDFNTLYNGTLLTSTSQNRVKYYDWVNSGRPSNLPLAGSGYMEMSITFGSATVTWLQQECTIQWTSNLTHNKFSRSAMITNSGITWTPWSELTQESRALTEEEITNIWNNVFN